MQLTYRPSSFNFYDFSHASNTPPQFFSELLDCTFSLIDGALAGLIPELAAWDLGDQSFFLQVLAIKVVGRESRRSAVSRRGHLQVDARED